MNDCADLELIIHRQDEHNYAVDFRFSDNDPNNDTDMGVGAKTAMYAAFNLETLKNLLAAGEIKEYGQALTDCLFADQKLHTAFTKSRMRAEDAKKHLRIRLNIHPSALELYTLAWETLADPDSRLSFCMDQMVYFSRYLSSLDWRPMRLRAKGQLKALAVIAAPNGLDKYKLAPVNKAVELKIIKAGLGNIPVDVVEKATLEAIVTALTNTEYDVIYLVAHGKFVEGKENCLWLEDENQEIERVLGTDLVTRISGLEHRPRLAVLVSCQSAGKGEGEVLSSLGPRLADAGIPAVLAMQDNLLIATAEKFIPLFFSELQKDGQIDRALTIARSQILKQADWWVPALFMRLKSGRLWYNPGFASEFKKFPLLLQNIENKHLAPILGPGLMDGLFGSSQQIARNWAESFRYPMAPHERDSLPQMAQFLTIDQDINFPYENLMGHLRKRLQIQFRKQLPQELLTRESTFLDVLKAAGSHLREDNLQEPHKVLAKLPVEIYLTTNADTLLEAALQAAGKLPRTRVCPWNEHTAKLEGDIVEEENYTTQRPLVYHLFGLWEDLESIVLTEDNYFEFLLGMTNNKALIPKPVLLAMTNNCLLFLGFQTYEWQFRVLMHAILSFSGRNKKRSANIAAQIEPEDGHILEPEGARQYLEQYFSKSDKMDLSIYWGNAEEFLGELMNELGKSEVGTG